jgi:hypothetical protein
MVQHFNACVIFKNNDILMTITLRTYDTFPTNSVEKVFQPPPFEEFLEINFQFSMVSILHRFGHVQQ